MMDIRKMIRAGMLSGVLAGVAMTVHASASMEEIYVDFEHIYTEHSQEYGIIEAFYPDGSRLWTYETALYDCTQLERITEIGCKDDAYYLCEDGAIKKFDLATGMLLWENEDFSGSATDWLFDDEDNLYVCGYFGPDLYAVSAEGETLNCIDMASVDLYWPYDLSWYDENTIEITYEGTEMGQDGSQSLLIDISDMRDGIQDAYGFAPDDYAYAEAIPQYSGDTYYVVNCRESITLRTQPSVYASEICQMPLGSAVDYLGYAENGFYYVQYNGMTGYALASYLSSEYTSGYSTYWVVNCKQSITLRKVPSTDGPEICQMPLGSAVTFVSRADNGFYCVEYNGQTGYALASYLSADAYYGGYVSSMCQVVNCRESITLRTSPSIYASEICQMPLGACVTYLGFAGNGFYQVEFNGRVGYALASYLMFI
jgi:hypothetical protein